MSQKRCDDCGYVLDGSLVSECDGCHVRSTCTHCAHQVARTDGSGTHDTLCKKCGGSTK